MNKRTAIAAFLAATILVSTAWAGPDDPVTFNDVILKQAVIDRLKSLDPPIITTAPTPNEMANIQFFGASNKGITDLTGLEAAVNMYHLYLPENQIVDVSALSEMSQLAFLELSRNQIVNVAPLCGLPNLYGLRLNENSIISVDKLAPLADFGKLTTLELQRNQITDITALKGFTLLRILELGANKISNISALSGMTQLTLLNLGFNIEISNLDALVDMKELKTLELSANAITNIGPMAGLIKLEQLGLYFNFSLENIDALGGLINLKGVNLMYNNISDISALSGCVSLEILQLRKNQISNIWPLTEGLTQLKQLYLTSNPLECDAYCGALPIILKNNVNLTLWTIPEYLYDCQCVLSINIDIKPGSYPNTINLGSNGVVQVAILSDADFDATTVDPSTVTLAGASVAIRGKGDRLLATEEDIDDDGDLDLVLKIVTENFDPESFQGGWAVLTGQTYDGQEIEGEDTINIVPLQ